MIKFSDYKLILEKFTLKYFSFDWDDNILFMDTKIHMQQKVGGEWIDTDVGTSKFAKIRNDDNWRVKNNDFDLTFSEFRDFGPRGDIAFLEDVKQSISMKKFGPVWEIFIECIVNGSIFSIITARGHEPESIRRAIEYIIENYLSDIERDEMAANLNAFHNLFNGTDFMESIQFDKLVSEYLDSCYFVGVSSDSFMELYGDSFDPSSPEEGKKLAIEMFVKKIHSYGDQVGADIKIGFSDDDKSNLDHIHKFFKNELSLKYIMEYTVFDTSNPNLKGGVKTDIKSLKEFYGFIDYSKWESL